MYIRDYYFRDELIEGDSAFLLEEWNRQKSLIDNDVEYVRPNNRMTMTIIEDILEDRQIQINYQTGKAIVNCLQCNEENMVMEEEVYIDENGRYIVCKHCEGSFDVFE